MFLWVGAQVPSLVSKYIKGLVWRCGRKTPRACLCKCANCTRRTHVCIVELTARGNRDVVLILSPGVSLPSLLTYACFRITMAVSALAKNNQTPLALYLKALLHRPEIKTVATSNANALGGCTSGRVGKNTNLRRYIVSVIHTRRL